VIPLWQQSKIDNRQKVIPICSYHIFYTNRRFLVCGYRHLVEKIWGCRGWQCYYLPRTVNFWGCRRKRRNCQSHVTTDLTNPRYIYIERFNNKRLLTSKHLYYFFWLANDCLNTYITSSDWIIIVLLHLYYFFWLARTDTLKFSFFPRTVPTWNMLPATVAEAPDLVSFKRGLASLQF
jgi:hypothetical protein